MNGNKYSQYAGVLIKDTYMGTIPVTSYLLLESKESSYELVNEIWYRNNEGKMILVDRIVLQTFHDWSLDQIQYFIDDNYLT